MDLSKFTPSGIIPELPVFGQYQRFAFSENSPSIKLQSYSQFAPTVLTDSVINIESRNNLLSGFRWKHTSKSTDTNGFGSFKFQSFVSDGAGTDIWGFDGTNINAFTILDMGSSKIINLSPPTSGTDAANKNYVDSMVGSGTVTLTGNVTGSGSVGGSIATTIASRLNQIPTPTSAVNINSQNLISVGNLGIGVASPNHQIDFPGVTSDCKISLYGGVNNFQVYGFGVISNTLKYSVDQPSSSHVFYCGASSTTSTELFRIAGAGYATVSGGDGTFYSRVPSIHISRVGGSSTTTPTGSWIKLNTTTSATTGAVQFTTSSNRITFTGSDLGTACTGMVSASAVLLLSSLSSVNLGIYKNGSLIASSFCWGTNTAVGTSISVNLPTVMVSLSPADYLEVWALSIGVTITTQYLNLSFTAC